MRFDDIMKTWRERWVDAFTEHGAADSGEAGRLARTFLAKRHGALVNRLKAMKERPGLKLLLQDNDVDYLEWAIQLTDDVLERLPNMKDDPELRTGRFKILKTLGWLHCETEALIGDFGDGCWGARAGTRCWLLMGGAENILKTDDVSARWARRITHPVDTAWQLSKKSLLMDPDLHETLHRAASEAYRLEFGPRMAGMVNIRSVPADANFLNWLLQNDGVLLQRAVGQTVQAARKVSPELVRDRTIVVGSFTLGSALTHLRPAQVADLLKTFPDLARITGWAETAQRVDLMAVVGGGDAPRPRNL